MYGFSGYATNSYATRRLFGGGIVAPVVKLAMRILTSGYGIMNGLLLRFRGTKLRNPTNGNNTLEL
jgi:hypothetical protein